MDTPNLGLLLDIDGPIASPVTRTIAIPSIIDDLLTLTAAGVPVAFITGRSDAFVQEQVVSPLMDAGLGNILHQPHTRMFGVFEKGGCWAEITAGGMGEVTVDQSVSFPPEAVAAIRSIVSAHYTDALFFDQTKRVMISVEHRTDVEAAVAQAAQARFEEQAFEALTGLGLGLRYGETDAPGSDGTVPFRIDPTIISTDIESVTLDKDRGAQRAMEYFQGLGDVPRRWCSVGDSRSDYKMADQLHADGYDTAHVDVRPAEGILEKPYEIITLAELTNDAAGAAFLADCVANLR